MSLLDKFKKKSDPLLLKKPKMLISSSSPICPIEAFAEDDGRTCYFYMNRFPNSRDAELTACFVCNSVGIENEIPLEEWLKDSDGHAPMIPYSEVTHDTAGLTLSPDELEIVWTMEGSGAGLLRNGELLAFIPEWADQDSFCGYSKYIKGKTDFGCEMTSAKPHLDKVIAAGRSFWEKMSGDYWSDFQQSGLDALSEFMGEYDKYYAIDGGRFPTRALIAGEKNGIRYGFTLGMSLLRQPMVEPFYQRRTADFARVELGFACRAEQESAFTPVLQRMAAAAALPWATISSLGHGHTITLKGVDGFPAAWLINDNLLKAPAAPKFAPTLGERVNLLWIVPITQREYDYLLEYDMEKLFPLRLPCEITVFDGVPKLPLERLKQLAEKPTERDESDNAELMQALTQSAVDLLERGSDYDDADSAKARFGYLFDIDEHGLEALFELTTDRGVFYFAAQKDSLLRLDINREMFLATSEQFLSLHQ